MDKHLDDVCGQCWYSSNMEHMGWISYIYLVGGLPNLQTNADSHGLVIYHDQSSSVRDPSIIPLYLLADTDFPLGFFESLKTLG